MNQNIYDNPDFFSGYMKMRDDGSGMNECLEQPTMHAMLPDMTGLEVLELGCGAGRCCRQLIEYGAAHVDGVDISANMLQAAKASTPDEMNISYHQTAIQDFSGQASSYDLVLSSLAFHYIADLEDLFAKIAKWLKPNGLLIFSTEHPMATCSQGLQPGWHRDEKGEEQYWMVDGYTEEGLRESHWFVDGVQKYHRTFATLLNTLIQNQFVILQVEEPHALESFEADDPTLKIFRKRPPFLFVKAKKG